MTTVPPDYYKILLNSKEVKDYFFDVNGIEQKGQIIQEGAVFGVKCDAVKQKLTIDFSGDVSQKFDEGNRIIITYRRGSNYIIMLDENYKITSVDEMPLNGAYIKMVSVGFFDDEYKTGSFVYKYIDNTDSTKNIEYQLDFKRE